MNFLKYFLIFWNFPFLRICKGCIYETIGPMHRKLRNCYLHRFYENISRIHDYSSICRNLKIWLRLYSQHIPLFISSCRLSLLKVTPFPISCFVIRALVLLSFLFFVFSQSVSFQSASTSQVLTDHSILSHCQLFFTVLLFFPGWRISPSSMPRLFFHIPCLRLFISALSHSFSCCPSSSSAFLSCFAIFLYLLCVHPFCNFHPV